MREVGVGWGWVWGLGKKGPAGLGLLHTEVPWGGGLLGRSLGASQTAHPWGPLSRRMHYWHQPSIWDHSPGRCAQLLVCLTSQVTDISHRPALQCEACCSADVRAQVGVRGWGKEPGSGTGAHTSHLSPSKQPVKGGGPASFLHP